ncbi:hypothetical protein AS888_04190 [Peribacillus simplex]|uniref:Uncharacterized protein n=1 Tax=Peribacillus simplex TaxID=1478 RepID=A0A120GQS0_9BACI|nr:hypothetical protein [Peribacillus simplex]KWW21717.1 hypothetical protein AS888_04190 [Peribacillus simplex]
MKIVAIVRLVLIIVIPAFMMRRSYKKMSKEERHDFMTEVASKRFAATYGLVALSFVFLLLHPIFEFTWLKTGSAVFFSIGMIVSCVFVWLYASSKWKAVLRIISALIAIVIFLWWVTK